MSSPDLEWQTFPTNASVPSSQPAAPPAAPEQQQQGSAYGRASIDDRFGLLSLLQPSVWKELFSVTTADVTTRLQAPLMPWRNTSFYGLLGGRPDWYSLWVPATLVAETAIVSNLSSWLHFRSAPAVAVWQYSAASLSTALSAVFGYVLFAAWVLWAATTYQGGRLGFFSTVCLYCYAQVPLLPAALLCVLPVTSLQWLAIVSGCGFSAAFLVRNLLPMAGGAPPASPLRLSILAAAAAQLAFGLLVKAFFFTYA